VARLRASRLDGEEGETQLRTLPLLLVTERELGEEEGKGERASPSGSFRWGGKSLSSRKYYLPKGEEKKKRGRGRIPEGREGGCILTDSKSPCVGGGRGRKEKGWGVAPLSSPLPAVRKKV